MVVGLNYFDSSLGQNSEHVFDIVINIPTYPLKLKNVHKTPHNVHEINRDTVKTNLTSHTEVLKHAQNIFYH